MSKAISLILLMIMFAAGCGNGHGDTGATVTSTPSISNSGPPPNPYDGIWTYSLGLNLCFRGYSFFPGRVAITNGLLSFYASADLSFCSSGTVNYAITGSVNSSGVLSVSVAGTALTGNSTLSGACVSTSSCSAKSSSPGDSLTLTR